MISEKNSKDLIKTTSALAKEIRVKTIRRKETTIESRDRDGVQKRKDNYKNDSSGLYILLGIHGVDSSNSKVEELLQKC